MLWVPFHRDRLPHTQLTQSLYIIPLSQPLFNDIRDLTPQPTSTNETVAVAAVSAAMEQDASALLVLTTSGVSAALLSKYRPKVPIITVTRDAATARQLSLHRGCYTFWYPEKKIAEGSTEWQVDVDNRIRYGLKSALALGMIKPGQTVVAIQVCSAMDKMRFSLRSSRS